MLIEEYFQSLETAISSSPYVTESRILKDKRSLHIGVVEGQIKFFDNSALHFMEFVTTKDEPTVYKYSYHYQDQHGKLIFRYDMAPHHVEIHTFPHHKHVGLESVIPCPMPSLSRVLAEIGDLVAALRLSKTPGHD